MTPLIVLSMSCRTDVEVVVGEQAPVEPALYSRERRRMNIDQLKASMEQTSGGISWTEEVAGDNADLFEQLSVTLGRPDYLASTEEMLAPDLLFQKFLDDAAKSICTQLVAEDPWRSASERTLIIHGDLFEPPDSEAVALNLQAALLRFHGRDLALEDPQLQTWIDLYTDVYDLTGSGSSSWQLVCVTLYTHPDFYSF